MQKVYHAHPQILSQPFACSPKILRAKQLALDHPFLRHQGPSMSATLSALDHLVEDQVNDLLDMLHLLVDLRVNVFPEKAIFVMMTA